MKKSLVVLTILVLLSAAGIPWANGQIGDDIDEVEFEANPIYGEAALVEGVTVTRDRKYMDYMYWDIACIISDEPETETEFTFDRFDDYEGVWNEYEGIGNGYWEPGWQAMETTGDGSDLMGIDKAFYELRQETPAGESGKKEVKLADYTPYYEFALCVELPGISYGYNMDETMDGYEDMQAFQEAFAEFFKIPVLEEELYVIGINKNVDNEVTGYGMATVDMGLGTGDYSAEDIIDDGDSFRPEINSVFTEDTCYFTFSPLSFNGQLVDTSLISGGYGIYSFKFDSEKGNLDGDSLRLEYAMEPTGYIDMKIDVAGENLLVFHEDAEQFYLTVLDLETVKERQTIAYGVRDEEMLARCYWVYDDFLVAQYDYNEAMIFSRNADGTYAPEYVMPAYPLDLEKDAYFLESGVGFDWDGERIIVAAPLMSGEPLWTRESSFYLAVIDRNGLLYYGEYYCSLDTETADYADCLDESYTHPITVTWN